MTNQHPIVPSPEQVDQWFDDAVRLNSTPKYYIAREVALWSADQELEACCEWLAYEGHEHEHLALHAARRPKPPSLKEQALEALQFVDEKLDLPLHNHCNAIHTIRRALEALPND